LTIVARPGCFCCTRKPQSVGEFANVQKNACFQLPLINLTAEVLSLVSPLDGGVLASAVVVSLDGGVLASAVVVSLDGGVLASAVVVSLDGGVLASAVVVPLDVGVPPALVLVGVVPPPLTHVLLAVAADVSPLPAAPAAAGVAARVVAPLVEAEVLPLAAATLRDWETAVALPGVEPPPAPRAPRPASALPPKARPPAAAPVSRGAELPLRRRVLRTLTSRAPAFGAVSE
jgi:hypothetical protein